jgi:NADPH-dependent ferric siderophore reductase
MNEGPKVTRVRHELQRRRLTVARVQRLPPNMVRVVLSGEDLQGFTSLGFDDHVKLIFPFGMRDFTPRRFDATSGELWIDFFLHDGGPAATWAAQAAVGQTLEVGGPKGSALMALDGIDGHVLIGDESALPAIGRRLEELPEGTPALVLVETAADADRPLLAGRGSLQFEWVPRDGRGSPPAHELIAALRQLKFPPGRCFVWVAGESHAARAIRTYLRDERGLDRHWVKAAGYWQRGRPGTHDHLADEA